MSARVVAATVAAWCAIAWSVRRVKVSGHKRRAGEQEEAGGLHRGGGGKRNGAVVQWQKLN